MGVREADEDAVGVVIPGTPVPPFVDVVGTELYHPVGYTGSYEYVAVITGANVRVYVG